MHGWQKRNLKTLAVLTFSVIACLVSVICIYQKEDSFSASVAIACVGQKYEKNAEGTWLIFEYSDKKTVKKIKIDEKLKEDIAENNAAEVIGIQVVMNIPQRELKAYHFNTKDMHLAWFLFDEGMFDNYCEIVGMSFESNGEGEV